MIAAGDDWHAGTLTDDETPVLLFLLNQQPRLPAEGLTRPPRERLSFRLIPAKSGTSGVALGGMRGAAQSNGGPNMLQYNIFFSCGWWSRGGSNP